MPVASGPRNRGGCCLLSCQVLITHGSYSNKLSPAPEHLPLDQLGLAPLRGRSARLLSRKKTQRDLGDVKQSWNIWTGTSDPSFSTRNSWSPLILSVGKGAAYVMISASRLKCLSTTVYVPALWKDLYFSSPLDSMVRGCSICFDYFILCMTNLCINLMIACNGQFDMKKKNIERFFFII